MSQEGDFPLGRHCLLLAYLAAMQTAVQPNKPGPSGTVLSERELADNIVKASVDNSWVNTLALLVANGVSLEMAATRLGRPKVQLERAMQMPSFKKQLADLALESHDDVGVKLIQGSLVDSVHTLIKFRDDPATPPRDRINICKYLIDSVLGRAKSGLGLVQTALAQVGALGNGDLDAGVDAEIARLVDNNPVLKARLSGRTESTAPAELTRLLPESAPIAKQVVPTVSGLPA